MHYSASHCKKLAEEALPLPDPSLNGVRYGKGDTLSHGEGDTPPMGRETPFPDTSPLIVSLPAVRRLRSTSPQNPKPTLPESETDLSVLCLMNRVS